MIHSASYLVRVKSGLLFLLLLWISLLSSLRPIEKVLLDSVGKSWWFSRTHPHATIANIHPSINIIECWTCPLPKTGDLLKKGYLHHMSEHYPLNLGYGTWDATLGYEWGVPADATLVSLHTVSEDTVWRGCTLLKKETEWSLPWLPPRVASLKTSLRVRLFSLILLIKRILETITALLIASSMEAE